MPSWCCTFGYRWEGSRWSWLAGAHRYMFSSCATNETCWNHCKKHVHIGRKDLGVSHTQVTAVLFVLGQNQETAWVRSWLAGSCAKTLYLQQTRRSSATALSR